VYCPIQADPLFGFLNVPDVPLAVLICPVSRLITIICMFTAEPDRNVAATKYGVFRDSVIPDEAEMTPVITAVNTPFVKRIEVPSLLVLLETIAVLPLFPVGVIIAAKVERVSERAGSPLIVPYCVPDPDMAGPMRPSITVDGEPVIVAGRPVSRFMKPLDVAMAERRGLTAAGCVGSNPGATPAG
jgi:hypothetical protein